ncbi:hypothetical protein G7048_16715 [Diaphorobacter sp. HDW4B]|uniref:hypothetical protein n=1 Tax=Diaphorobacter sp. HDW4B TaxID=2714925 RepID=UPI00140B1F18|nr:hypothetical protein [Diaphorobacter sp. HDW4B]QIL71853.1 hypothetical protein G7048_16715 [Diaphorobacter sp. HDW4B]
MPTKKPALQIALEAPWTLGDVAASRFAVLLLLALAVARRAGQPMVPVYSLHFAGQTGTAFPMALSRAFKQFAQAGITVGWGRNARADASALSVRGRVHGPFWLVRGELERLTFCVSGKQITHAMQKSLLVRMSGTAQSASECTVGEGLEEQLERWMRVFVLRQSAEEGRLSLPEVMDGLSRVHYRDAPDSSGDASPLWALNLQARYARLARKSDEARALYKELRRRCRSAALKRGDDDDSFQRLPVLDAMSEIGLAWCDHQDNRSAAALMRLEQMSDRFEGDAASLRLSSRLAAEYFNLRALARRALLLGASHEQPEQDAVQVLRDMQLALVCAVETDSLTLMEAVASNLGYSLWLLAPSLQQRVGADAGRRLAVRWILTGEALARRHGLGSGSYWNIIYICRIARGAVADADTDADGETPSMPLEHLRARIWSLADLRTELAQGHGEEDDPAVRELHSLCELLLPSSLPDWLTLTARMLAAVSEDAGDQTISPIQRCAAMLEHLWQLVLHDKAVAAADLRRDLEMQLSVLQVAQRKYFRADLARLPRI